MIQLFLIQLVGHMLGDFYFQNEYMCTCKKETEKKSICMYLLHIVIVFLTAWGITWTVSFWWAALLIALLHAFVDIVKSFLLRLQKNEAILFYIDQLVHILTIGLSVWLYQKHCGWIEWEWLTIYRAAMIVTFVFCFWPANFYIGEFLDIIKVNKRIDEKYNTINVSKPTLDASRVIGSMERVLIILFVWLGQYGAIGFLIAAKSVMRFPEMGNGNNAEYYLVGSLLSFGLAILLTTSIMVLHSKGFF